MPSLEQVKTAAVEAKRIVRSLDLPSSEYDAQAFRAIFPEVFKAVVGRYPAVPTQNNDHKDDNN